MFTLTITFLILQFCHVGPYPVLLIQDPCLWQTLTGCRASLLQLTHPATLPLSTLLEVCLKCWQHTPIWLLVKGKNVMTQSRLVLKQGFLTIIETACSSLTLYSSLIYSRERVQVVFYTKFLARHQEGLQWDVKVLCYKLCHGYCQILSKKSWQEQWFWQPRQLAFPNLQ